MLEAAVLCSAFTAPLVAARAVKAAVPYCLTSARRHPLACRLLRLTLMRWVKVGVVELPETACLTTVDVYNVLKIDDLSTYVTVILAVLFFD